MNKNDPAFPYVSGHYEPKSGMPILDYFAGQALIGLLASGVYCVSSAERVAKNAYTLAEAMVKERRMNVV